jgi:hypothetical protein
MTERTDMHAIVKDDQDLKEARQEFVDAAAQQDDYALKVKRARLEYKAEQQAALERGEVHSPRLEVIPDQDVQRHLRERREKAALGFSERAASSLRRLAAKLEAREKELLDSVGRLKVSELQRIAAEVGELATAKEYLQGLAGWRGYHGEPPTEPRRQVMVTAAQVLEAALDGGSVIGRTPPPPEPARVVDYNSPQGEAVMSGMDGAGGRIFR